MAEEELEHIQRRLSELLDNLIKAWAERESVEDRVEELRREGLPAPPQPQPVEDLAVLAQHARATRLHDSHRRATLRAMEGADKAYADIEAELLKELVPENLTGTQTYLSVTHTHPEGVSYLIDIRPDSIIVRRQEQ